MRSVRSGCVRGIAAEIRSVKGCVTTSAVRSRALWLLCSSLACALVAVGCGNAAREQGAAASETKELPAPTIALRFRPQDQLKHREHWVYDTAIPGSGLGRNALSLDVALAAKVDQDSFAVKKTVRAHQMMLDGKPFAAPSLVGATLMYVYGRDNSLAAEISAEGATPVIAAAAKLVAQIARFGTLVEYPDQAVGERDSWSIEPRQLVIVPGVEATLRPTYTIESLGRGGLERTATIATDIQVDVVPLPIAEGIRIEGGGTAAGTQRVRLRDGVLMEARAVMHFSQEITVQGSEILGYREFSATAHMFTDPGTGDPDLARQPYGVQAPEHDPECDLQVASAMQRLRKLPAQARVSTLHALRGVSIPVAAGGEPLEVPGATLIVFPDERPAELDGQPIETKTLGQALRKTAGSKRPLYVYADASLPMERVASLLASLPARIDARLIVRDTRQQAAAPKTERWLDERLRLTAALPTHPEREKRLHELIFAHLSLCEPALAAFQKAIGDDAHWSSLPSTAVSKFLGCGCTATNLESLEALLEVVYGTSDLRWRPLPRALGHEPVPPATLGEFAKLLAAGKAHERP